ncbi:PIN domain-containing protein [Vibrio splendidus]|uniref:PIN domain-containing protein n=1 Tax=Vibrio splendidus TaxID=29497 RepID=UPI000D353145|nr:PIN domain-containing protein [Vibrio splendidus]PTO76073.1 hypothetical protein CWN81_03000 [Vibrio splendidus]
MNVFIDTNIYFTFYNLSSEKIDELKKALILHREKKITLWLPELVVNEFWRNRASEISHLTTDFKKNIKLQIPQLVLSDEHSSDLIQAQKDLNKIKSEISQRLEKKIKDEVLDADIAVKEIFEHSKKIKDTPELIELSIRRYDLGNPPGKKGSYGDALNWESLLNGLPEGEDLHVISNDGDFYSPMNKDAINEYLNHEWGKKKKSNVMIYRRLSAFIAQYFPEAKSAAELERNIAIEGLNNSGSFMTTHNAISKLAALNEFNQAQVVRIVSIYHDNEQVRWISTDDDVKAFGHKLIDEYSNFIDKEDVDKFKQLIEYA